ncbi:MAG: hypothetical protein ABI818_01835 [Acidobacteriota bacterium]
MTTNLAACAFFLSLFTVLLVMRVIGQIVVVVFSPRWLPPMEQWQSGLLPYPVLLAGQACVLTVMIWISADFSRAAGVFFRPMPHIGRAALLFSYVYAGGMILRYAVRMARRPDQRWLGGTIPIIFHSVVAAFLWTFGHFHLPL